MFHNFFKNDGQKNPLYAANFKSAKYLKIVCFVGYGRNYIESIPSNSPTDHSDLENQLNEIAPTYIIESIDVFEVKHLSNYKK